MDDVYNAPEGGPEVNEDIQEWKEGAIKLVTETHTSIGPSGETKEMIYKWTMSDGSTIYTSRKI